MDDRYVCPDCSAEHMEPLEATLGHVVRCLGCAIIADGYETQRDATLPLEIHIAA